MITLFCVRPKGFNVGNDAIFQGTQQFLHQAFGQVVNIINVPATSRYESQAKAGLTPKTIYDINQYGHGVIVGGGNLYENGELDVNLDALETLEVPLMLFSLSRGGVYNRRHQLVPRTDAMPARIMQGLNKKAKYSLARDGVTGAFLKSIGCDHVLVGGCPTIFLDRSLDRLPKLYPADTSGVLISVRHPSLMSIPLPKQSQVHADIEAMLSMLKKRGHKNIRLLCHDHRDISFAASFTGVDYVYTDDIYTYLALLKACDLNITYRLHSFLPCLAFGTPTIKISYDERALSLVDTIGYSSWNIDMIQSPSTIDAVTNRYERLKELPELRNRASERWGQLEQTMTTTFSAFAKDVVAYANSK